MNGSQFYKLSSELADEERSLREMSKYMENVKSTGEGFGLIADQLSAHFNTLFGDELTPAQYRTLLETGQLQGLLGGFRKEVIGGGVMTEKDAERVLARLGGDVSLLRNKAVAEQLLGELFEEKARRYNEMLVPTYNSQLKIPRGGFQPKNRIEIQFSRNPLAPPAVGTIEDGYEYMGGPPENPASWRQVR
jgi:hypothetical protein